ncbi:MAG TPA: SRPBCC family protein [Chloroflexota bacterium]
MTTNSTSATTFSMPSDLEIVMSRVFDAPRELVWKAVTEPRHLAQWWGPREYTLSVCEVDLRPGGAWHFVHRAPDGNEYPFRGVYREVAPPERLVNTQIFDVEPYSSLTLLVTITLTAVGDRQTLLTSTSLFESTEHRDGMVASGMRKGATDSFERLAELLHTLVASGGSNAATA